MALTKRLLLPVRLHREVGTNVISASDATVGAATHYGLEINVNFNTLNLCAVSGHLFNSYNQLLTLRKVPVT